MVRITKEQLVGFHPCYGTERIDALFGRRKYLTTRLALSSGVPMDDVLWVAQKLGRKDLIVRFALACAQRVAYLNPDPRVQAALDATQAWLDNPAAAAGNAARAAAWAARAARDAAGNAGNAARAAGNAAWAARDAAGNAGNAAAWAAWAAEQQAQREIMLEIFK